MEKITFYQERTFGDKFTVVFEFIKQNWKPMLRYGIYGILPLCLIAAFSMNTTFSSVLAMQQGGYQDDAAVSYGMLCLVGMCSFVWIGDIVFSCMQLYNEREDGLEGIVYEDLKPYLKRNAWRLVKCGLLSSLFFILLFSVSIGLSLATESFIFLLFFFIFFVAVIVLWILVIPTYIFEDLSVWQAFARGLRLGWNTWGGIFCLGFVLSILGNVAAMIFVMPWEICLVIKSVFVAEGGTSTILNSFGYTMFQYLLGVVMWLGQYLLSSVFFVSAAYLYSHAAEQIDDMSVATGIDHFEEMADQNQDDGLFQ